MELRITGRGAAGPQVHEERKVVGGSTIYEVGRDHRCRNVGGIKAATGCLVNQQEGLRTETCGYSLSAAGSGRKSMKGFFHEPGILQLFPRRIGNL